MKCVCFIKITKGSCGRHSLKKYNGIIIDIYYIITILI